MQQQRHPADSDTNTVSKISVEIESDSDNYYVTYKFEQCDDVFVYASNRYTDISEMLSNNSLTAPIAKDTFTNASSYFRLRKGGLPRYVTVTFYEDNGELKAQPVQYTNTPFA